MPSCIVCGEEDFYLQEGFYFCSNCQTQSQQVRELGDDDDVPLETLRFRNVIRTAKTRSKKDRKVDAGRKWMLEEGFTIILKTQVNQLIELGAKPEVKKCVFQLWSYYLKKCHIAFCNNPLWLQDKHTRKRQCEKEKTTWQQRAEKRRKVEQEMSNRAEKEALEEAFGGEEFYEGDNPLEGLDNESSDSSDEESSKKKKREELVTDPEWMTVNKTLSFLYLGLLYSGHNITLIQLIRWAKKGKIVLKNPQSCFPSDVKFSGLDASVFQSQTSVVKLWVLRRQCSALIAFLELKHLPQPDIPQLAASYIIQLALPGEMHGRVHKLMQQLPPSPQPSSPVLNYDVVAVAYIIIAMKLLFGFDDFREKQLSSYARELTAKLKLNQKLFIWDEWVNMHELHQQSLHKYKLPHNVQEAGHIRDITKIVESEAQSKFQNQVKVRRVHNRSEVQDQIAKPFKALMITMHDTQSTVLPSTSDARPHCSTFVDDCPLEFMLQDEDPPGGTTHTGESLFTKKELYFSSTTLSYITEGVDFLEHLGNHGLADATLSSYHSMSQSDDLSSQAAMQTVKQAIMLGLQTDHQVIDHDNPLTLISHRLSLTKNKYLFYKFGISKFHHSYQWLLDLCANMLDMTPLDVHASVRSLEVLLFEDERTVLHGGNSIRKFMDSFARKYFNKTTCFCFETSSDSDMDDN